MTTSHQEMCLDESSTQTDEFSESRLQTQAPHALGSDIEIIDDDKINAPKGNTDSTNSTNTSSKDSINPMVRIPTPPTVNQEQEEEKQITLTVDTSDHDIPDVPQPTHGMELWLIIHCLKGGNSRGTWECKYYKCGENDNSVVFDLCCKQCKQSINPYFYFKKNGICQVNNCPDIVFKPFSLIKGKFNNIITNQDVMHGYKQFWLNCGRKWITVIGKDITIIDLEAIEWHWSLYEKFGKLSHLFEITPIENSITVGNRIYNFKIVSRKTVFVELVNELIKNGFEDVLLPRRNNNNYLFELNEEIVDLLHKEYKIFGILDQKMNDPDHESIGNVFEPFPVLLLVLILYTNNDELKDENFGTLPVFYGVLDAAKVVLNAVGLFRIRDLASL